MVMRRSIPLFLATAMLSFGTAWADDQDNAAPAASEPIAPMPDSAAAPAEGTPGMDTNVPAPPSDATAPGASDDSGPPQPQEGTPMN